MQIIDTPVLSIELPADIVSAINQQIAQYYMIREYGFRIEREAQESKTQRSPLPRGFAELKKGSAAAGNADIAAAKAVNSKIADEFSRYGVK
jgi:regulator of protease activity HflC (stomatin/prohibitin superfamily)